MYKSVSEMARIWQVSERTVRNYCVQGKIPGAYMENKAWRVPEDTKLPGHRTQRPIAIGLQDFADLIEKKCFYVDKTNFIREWWESNNHVTAIMRPRRFGKTLNMSMINSFFSLKYAKSKLFKDLNIWQYAAYKKLQGTYPVIFISFASIKENNYTNAIENIKGLIVNAYNEYNDLLDDDILTETDKEFFSSVKYSMSDAVAALAINRLCFFLYKKYAKKTIVLLDEYDTPMQEAFTNGYWKELSYFMRSFFNSSFKTNPYLERGLMTGITRISKESIFSDLNNLEMVTATSPKYATAFGFTEEEVAVALKDYGLSNMTEVKEWYDGFSFGAVKDIYNPWSIINYLDKKQFQLYWANTGSNSLINKIVLNSAKEIKIAFEELLQGRSIRVILDEQIVFDGLEHNPSSIWSLLLATGYLKIIEADTVTMEYEVALTNKEIQHVFSRIVKNWFAPVMYDYQGCVTALVTGDEDRANYLLNSIMESCFSYFDTAKKPENFYHGFVLGLLGYLSNRYNLTSNRESGLGRYDVMLEAKNKADKSVVLEFKVADKVGELAKEAEEALEQINKKNYARVLQDHGVDAANIIKYGLAFKGKQAFVKRG